MFTQYENNKQQQQEERNKKRTTLNKTINDNHTHRQLNAIKEEN